MNRSTAGKLGLLGALYLAQGLPYGFFTQALPVLLRKLGLSLPEIGLTSLLALPWALKFAWAPLVDRFGTRRTWILSLQLAGTGLAAAMALLDPERALPWLLAAVLGTNLVAATQDIATDGLAVELLRAEERGLGNGVQVAGYRVGMILGGGLLLILFDALGWSLVLLGMAAMIAASSLPLWRDRTLLRRAPRGERLPAFGWDWLRRPGALGWLGVLGVYKFGDYLAGGMLRPWLVDSGMDMADIGVMLGAVGFTAGLLGALAGGALIETVGRRASLVGFGALQALGIAGYAWAASIEAGRAGIWAAATFEHFVGGMATVALFTLMMDASRTERAATDYALQASAVVIATGAAAAWSGFLAESMGYAALFRLGAVLALAGVGLSAVPALSRITRGEAPR